MTQPPDWPSPQQPFLERPWVWGVAAAFVVGIGIGIGNAGGGVDETGAGAAAGTSTMPPAVVAATPSPTVAPPPVTAGTPAGVDVPMPDLVGVDLQTAQNTVQSSGVLLSRSHDLLGSRNQVLDSNWIVCTQNIPAGQQLTRYAEGLIDLGVVKREETCP